MTTTDGNGGGVTRGRVVITLDELKGFVQERKTNVIIGSNNPSLLFFLADLKPVCQILKEIKGELVSICIDEIGEFEFDNAIEVGKRNLDKYRNRLNELKHKKNDDVYVHALEPESVNLTSNI